MKVTSPPAHPGWLEPGAPSRLKCRQAGDELRDVTPRVDERGKPSLDPVTIEATHESQGWHPFVGLGRWFRDRVRQWKSFIIILLFLLAVMQLAGWQRSNR